MSSSLAGRMLRAVRYERRISQRDLVELSDVPRSTLERIEAGEANPRLDTLVKLLAGAGFSLGLLDHHERPLALHPERDVLVDRRGRHLPAHLRPVKTASYFDPVAPGRWWGWHHIAWPFDDGWVPEHTYWRRPPPPALIQGRIVPNIQMGCLWDDAT